MLASLFHGLEAVPVDRHVLDAKSMSAVLATIKLAAENIRLESR